MLAAPIPDGAPIFDPVYMAATMLVDPDEGTIEDYIQGTHATPWSLAAKRGKRDPDYPTYAEAMSGPHSREFIEGQKKELAELEKKGTWVKVDRSSIPDKANVIKSTWAFRIARLPSGEIKKFKSRFCCRGDTQIAGQDVWETFSPTVSWSTVRMLLTLAVQHKLKTQAIDISNAFVTAPLESDTPIYVEMPKGFEEPGKVLLLKKSLYGLRQSPRLFYNYLTDTFKELGFEVSENDACMFNKAGIMVVAYVDDILFFSKDSDLINKTISELEQVTIL